MISLQDPVGSGADDICTWIEVTGCLPDTTATAIINCAGQIDQQDLNHFQECLMAVSISAIAASIIFTCSVSIII